jgi:cobalamin biosynthesis Mg chelatase CobN
MLLSDFYNNFVDSYNEGDVASANASLMKELGNILVRNRQDFIDLLNESGIDAMADMSDTTLVDLFVNNVATNKKLILGASLLVNMHNKQMGFDGEEELSDEGVKAGYEVMCSYFNADGNVPLLSTLKGGASGGEVGAIAGAVSDVAKMTTQFSQARQKKRFGGTDALLKQQEAKAQITKQILESRQAEMETKQKSEMQKAKSKRVLYIIGGSVLVISAIGLVYYFATRGSKK